MPTLTSAHLLSLYIWLFTLYLSRKLWVMSKWTHGVSYLPTLEESYLSDHIFSLTPLEFIPLGWWWCTWPTWPAQPYRDESPQLGYWEKVNFGGELVSIWSADFHKVQRNAFCTLVLHFLWFLLTLILHLSPPPVGVGLSHDQVTWLQWNGTSFPIVMPLLSLCLWCGLHLSLFKGLLQSFTQLSDIVVDRLVFLCTPYHREIEVHG